MRPRLRQNVGNRIFTKFLLLFSICRQNPPSGYYKHPPFIIMIDGVHLTRIHANRKGEASVNMFFFPSGLITTNRGKKLNIK